MKFIHTADWHLGNKMYEINRNEEYENFFVWLKNQIETEEASTLIIAGDIYDIANPPLEARKQYNSFLASLLNSNCKNIIVVGGNHDSGALLDTEKDIFEALNIHVVGSLANTNLDECVFELIDKNNSVVGICAAVPFVREGELRLFFDFDCDDGTFSDKAYGELYKQILEEAKKLRGKRNIPIIATGHLYAADLEGRLSGLSEQEKTDDGVRVLDVVGKLGSVHVGIFPNEFDYVALGHIHYTTMVGKNPKVRYSGSPFVMGFDESNLPHNILSVDLDGENLNVKKINVPESNCYKRISGKTKDIISEIKKYIKNPPEKNCYIEACYEIEDGINIHDELEKISNELPKNISVVHTKICDVKTNSIKSFEAVDMEELKNFSSEEIFKRLIISKNQLLLSKLDDEEKEKMEAELIEKYLPLFLMIEAEVEGEK